MTALEEPLDRELKALVGKEIDITVVHHLEGQHVRTTGKLLEVNDALIKIELEYKDHFWSRSKKGIYICNRKATSILSILWLTDARS